ncbi:uncharacterized protein N7511_011487 [Penicillium nucicola]|uniref:uncharacterized protein n=1 Tax=Penicillium nucicola TaxID=1850975 RepID=UPI0025451B80|nr:uncharacterized protein N7511_011487 [Penicillium nucicola]KAJ5742468.1 hypothetical protein N7511_011487 [Penicillium nucicola]
MSSGLSFAELEAAAGVVIEILKTIPEFSNSRIVIIGGLGLWRYIRNYRTTESKTNCLLCHHLHSNKKLSFFYYKGSNGKLIQIDITPDWQVRPLVALFVQQYRFNGNLQSPYVPSAAIPISTVRPNALPYISELDLLIFKINSCGLRPTPGKKLRDATDASELLEDLSTKGPIVLSVSQKNVILQCLDDVARMSGRDKAWWIAKLALN